MRDAAPGGGGRPTAPRRSLGRRVCGALAVVTLAVGVTACGGGDTQGQQDPDLEEVEAQVAQLRLEVQTLRRELAALADTAVTTTSTPGPTATTVVR
ncbi:MAG: hypothetical protein ACKOA9_14505 [Actinomycetota bacterium]